MHQQKTVSPDAKGRITLGNLAKGVSGFNMIVDEEHRIILEPLVEVPAREKWLYENKKTLKQVQQGLSDAKNDATTRK